MRDAGAVALLVLLVIAVFGQTAAFDFVDWDDPGYVTENGKVQLGLTAETFRWALSATHMSNWHPLTWLSHILDVELFGVAPGAHHLVNVFWHALNALLLFAFFRLATGRLAPSLLVAALFAVHPLHVESVAWVAERKDVLSGFLWMGAMLAYLWYARRPSAWRYLAVAILLALGLMAKPMLVTLPLALWLLDVWPLSRVAGEPWTRDWVRSLRNRFLEKLPLLAMSVASSVVTMQVQRAGEAVADLESVDLGLRLANAALAYAGYLWHTLWPLELSFFYRYQLEPNVAMVAAAAALLALATALCVQALPRRPALAVGWLWYLGTLVPVIGLVQVGSQAMADRYAYLPLIGLFAAIAFSLPERMYRGRAGPSLMAALVVVSAGLAWRQTTTWRDNEALFRHAASVDRLNFVAQMKLAETLARRGAVVEAERHAREAMRLNQSPEIQKRGRLVLGDGALARRQFDLAETLYAEALDIDPHSALAYYKLGVAAHTRGDLALASERYMQALGARPVYSEALNNLGLIAHAQNRLQEAYNHFRAAVGADRRNAVAQYNLGALLEKSGSREQALGAYEAALAADPLNERARAAIERLRASGPASNR